MRAVRAVICGTVLATLGCAAQQGVMPELRLAESSSFEQLSATDWAHLRAGERVEQPGAFQARGAGYVGGLSYQLVSADPDEVLQALLDPKQLEQMLPQTQRVVALGAGYPTPGLELEQGNDFATATYSVVLEHDLQKREVRFRLDRSRPSDIKDVRGFFRVDPYLDGRSLITVGTALDVGSGLVRLLFEDMIERLILATPTQMKDYIESVTDAGVPSRVAQLP